jgi:hypothetical protein
MRFIVPFYIKDENGHPGERFGESTQIIAFACSVRDQKAGPEFYDGSRNAPAGVSLPFSRRPKSGFFVTTIAARPLASTRIDTGEKGAPEFSLFYAVVMDLFGAMRMRAPVFRRKRQPTVNNNIGTA